MKYIAIFLVLLCCFMGAASAAEDISTDVVSEVADDVAIAEEVSDADSQSDLPDSSLGTNIEEENLRASGTATVSDWTDLKNKSETVGTDYTINLNGPIPIGSTDIQFQNNAVIVGNDNSYITGTATNRIPFRSTSNNALSITFRNVKFQNINCQMLAQLQTTGTNIFDNCTFINITTGTGHDSVIYNNRGIMNVTDCTFTNCTTGYGVITNYRWGTTTGVTLNVKDSTFENNYASSEPGAINNCGILTVINSIFSKNKATMWAGAIHTHTNAYTHIEDSTFNDNVAGYGGTYGWNGGALFSYSKLEVINSVFTGNNVSVLTGGGAIFGYSMGTSVYNITVDSCNFTNNANNYDEGYAGAIGVQNIGYLTVTNSNFINNHATYGQAIYGITKNEPYCTNCTNCSCPNCPNCTNCSHTVSTGVPNCTIVNNVFVNHTGSGDTVVIAGQRYTFNYNIFINSTEVGDYDGDGNQYDLEDYPSRSSSLRFSKPVLGSSVLGDKLYHDVIYVNVSSSNSYNSDDVDGQSWENAYGAQRALNFAINHINNGGTIYVADGTYTNVAQANEKNYTMIGMEGTIFSPKEFKGLDKADLFNYCIEDDEGTVTYINITFTSPKVTLRGHKVFINCTFVGAPITTDKDTCEYLLPNPSQYTIDWTDRTFDFNFTNCSFVNYTTEGSVLEAFKTSQVNFNECTFENVTANSIANNTGDFYCEDGIHFKDCIFNNVNVKGIVDVPTGASFGEVYSIVGCTGVGSFGVVTEGDRDFVNTTVVAVDTSLSGVVEGDSAVITLKDVDGNNVAGAVVSYSINGAEAVNATTDENGQITISGLTGKGSIAVNYEGNDSFNANTTTIEFDIPEAQGNDTKVDTKLTAPKVSAVYNVAKKLVITLTDKNGNVLANKKVTVKVGSISKTLTTNAKGQASLNVATLVPKTYTATVKFAGDDGYAASSVSPKVVVSKAKPKFVAKKKTFKVKTKVKKYTVKLKNNKGKVLKKVKLTLKVGKKTYKAKTNNKGKAVFKIKNLKKKGKYNAKIKFAGNKYYKALSKKVKITVKK